MKKVLLGEDESILIRNVGVSTPIFAKKDGELRGMVIYEEDMGWILRTGGSFGSSGHHETREECLKEDGELDYEFFIE